MELNGRHTISTTPANLWNMLMDTETLSKIIPGLSTLEKTGDFSYKSILELKAGPISTSFIGDAQMEDIITQKKFTLKMQQSNKMGNANSTMNVELIPVNETETEVVFGGEIKITGLLASMGQPILSSFANMLTRQFFANLDRELASQQKAS
ncbi:MAG TPA: SRPBCC domain-containing protein [Chitinophagaceae bacterium]|nr:SRPBCC domain-containing protein [Chitinophagaceae bacterium]